jgi:hypothetical protein
LIWTLLDLEIATWLTVNQKRTPKNHPKQQWENRRPKQEHAKTNRGSKWNIARHDL